MNEVEKYLQHMREIRSSGGATDETSYYTPLNNLLDEIGKTVKPRVRCIMQLKNRGAGNPDGGLFTPEQFQKLTRGETLPGQKPSRGAIEVKPTEAGVKGVTSGILRPGMKVIGSLTLVSAKHVDPEKHLKIDVGWGHEGKEGITMGGKGQLVTRPYSDPERRAIEAGAAACGLSVEQAFAQLGEDTTDVYLNDGAYWKNVPTRALDFTIGGYQVLKKWLSYRETKLLGRVLTTDEAYYFRDMVRRIASLCLLESKLDANYILVKASTYLWPAPVIHTKHLSADSGTSK